jgi:hypothetical protein
MYLRRLLAEEQIKNKRQTKIINELDKEKALLCSRTEALEIALKKCVKELSYIIETNRCEDTSPIVTAFYNGAIILNYDESRIEYLLNKILPVKTMSDLLYSECGKNLIKLLYRLHGNVQEVINDLKNKFPQLQTAMTMHNYCFNIWKIAHAEQWITGMEWIEAGGNAESFKRLDHRIIRHSNGQMGKSKISFYFDEGMDAYSVWLDSNGELEEIKEVQQ